MAKTKIISFKIEEETKQAFELMCQKRYTTPSQYLYAFIQKELKKNKRSK